MVVSMENAKVVRFDHQGKTSWVPDQCWLSDEVAEKLRVEGSGDRTIRDSKITGFRLRKRVGKLNTSLKYTFFYSFKGKKGLRITFEEQSASDARIRAGECRQLLARGIDPKEREARAARRVAETVARESKLQDWTLRKALTEKAERDELAPGSIANYESLFNTSLADVVDKRLDDISTDDWRDHLRSLKNRKHPASAALRADYIDGNGNPRRPAAEYAGKVRMLVAALYKVAGDMAGIANPVHSLAKEFEVHQAVRGIKQEAKPLAELWTIANECWAPDQVRLLLLYMLTGMRDQEARGLRWDEVKEDRIAIAAGTIGRNKTGKKGKKLVGPRVIPMTPAIFSLLESQRNGRHPELVFPSRKGGKAEVSSLLPKLKVHGLSVHAMRKLFLTELDTMMCPAAVRYALGGHRPQDAADKNYLINNWELCEEYLQKVQHRISDQLVGVSEIDLRHMAMGMGHMVTDETTREELLQLGLADRVWEGLS